MPAAIKAANLGKRYQLGSAVRRTRYKTLRESLTASAAALLRRRGGGGGRGHDFWALKGIEFEIRPGEVVGIIGRNGAGKSTLLKILSRITKPTTGEVEVRGRLASLLEVGTGFHQELTGRENIYLNGSILGMSRREINRRFDEIVGFAEVEEFLDTPVKRYSSGMYVRLAFSVAAHLEPEILVIDEVLAVGDQSFQKKCLGKMGEVSHSGRTVLFVSHNAATIESLCDRCLLLNRGSLELDGPTTEVLTRYQLRDAGDSSGRVDLSGHQGRTGDSTPMMTEVVLGNGSEEPASCVRMGSPLTVRVGLDTGEAALNPVLGVVIKTGVGAAVFGVNNRFIPGFDFGRRPYTGSITCRVDRLPLMPGLYWVDLHLGDDHRDRDVVKDALSFEVVPADVFGTGKIPPPAAGPIYWPASWVVSA